MCALTHYEEYVRLLHRKRSRSHHLRAGLPTDLPKYTKGSSIKLAPIVSPPRTAKGSSEALGQSLSPRSLISLSSKVLQPEAISATPPKPWKKQHGAATMTKSGKFCRSYMATKKKYACTIPVVFAGGVYTHEDILHYLSLGCAGVQMATRFVVTEECDADPRYKQAYLNAKRRYHDHAQSGRHAGPRNPQSVSHGTRTGTGKKSHTATSASKNTTKPPFPTVLPPPWPALPMAIPTTLSFSAEKMHGVSIT